MNLDQLRAGLSGAADTDRTTFRPVILRASSPADAARMQVLVAAGATVHDELEAQLGELVRCLNPAKRYTKDELLQAAQEHLAGQDPLTYGVWIHYPWANRLVHLLDEAEFALVRTDRNRNKITREEQALLATKKVGVIGLSVGQSVCLTLALERSFGEIRLADFDTLDLSNLNRIRSGTHELGTPKVINTAREIAELDPFLKVTVFAEGITKDNIDDFLTGGGPLDLLVEECDSVDIKLLARQSARHHRIPVVMDTSDRGLIDVERFDLEPERPLLHGLLEDLDPAMLERPMTNQEKIPVISRFVGIETISARMRASLPEVGRTILTWPQLASAVVLGGAALADIARRILLGFPVPSQRQWLDLDELIPASAIRTETIIPHTA
ncbi:MAG: ThiF family adenylyltransferase [Flavobacteriales bacterium]|nr:ThiF family adenylyltransferase [Flavobacteriales bacterium]